MFTATIQDANGNTVTTGADSTKNVMFSQTAGTGSVSGLGNVNAVGGVAQVTVTGVLGGSVTLQASVSISGPTNSNTLTFTVVAGAATQIRVETAADGSGSVVPAENVAAGTRSRSTRSAVTRPATSSPTSVRHGRS